MQLRDAREILRANWFDDGACPTNTVPVADALAAIRQAQREALEAALEAASSNGFTGNRHIHAKETAKDNAKAIRNLMGADDAAALGEKRQ